MFRSLVGTGRGRERGMGWGHCLVSFTHAGRADSVLGLTHAQPVGGLSCVSATDGRSLLYVHFDPPVGTVAQPAGRYRARVWGASERVVTPGTFVLATNAFLGARSVRQLESVSGALSIVQWPRDGRDASVVQANTHVRVRTGLTTRSVLHHATAPSGRLVVL